MARSKKSKKSKKARKSRKNKRMRGGDYGSYTTTEFQGSAINPSATILSGTATKPYDDYESDKKFADNSGL